MSFDPLAVVGHIQSLGLAPRNIRGSGDWPHKDQSDNLEAAREGSGFIFP